MINKIILPYAPHYYEATTYYGSFVIIKVPTTHP
jgi:hypothetical protein